MGCNNQACFEIRARIANFDTDVEFLSISRRTLRWDTDQPVPGSETDIAPAAADPGVLDSLRRSIGRPSGFIVEQAACPDGCYCSIPEDAHAMHTIIAQDVYEFTYVYVATQWVIQLHPDLESLYEADGPGRRVIANPATDHLGRAAVREVDGVGQQIRFPLQTRFEARIRLKIWAAVFELHGTCVEVHVSDEQARV